MVSAATSRIPNEAKSVASVTSDPAQPSGDENRAARSSAASLADVDASGPVLRDTPTARGGRCSLRSEVAASDTAASSGVRHGAAVSPVVLVVTDTLRSDFLRDSDLLSRLPVLQRLLGESYVFERAYASSHWTLPAHGSLFTGLLPSEHGASPPAMRLRDDVPTLAEVFRAAGYRTGLASCNAFLSSMFGMTRGFEEVWEPPRSVTSWSTMLADEYLAATPKSEGWRGTVRAAAEAGARFVATTPRSDNGGRAAVGHASAFLARAGPPPFLVLNLMEAHSPYHARGAFHGLGARIRHLRIMATWEDYVFGVMGGGTVPTTSEFDAIRAMYWDNVAYLDARLGELLSAGRGGFWDRAFLVLVSDHGQMLGERGELDHIAGLWEPLLRVPLVVRPPGGVPSRRVDRPVAVSAVFAFLSQIARGTAALPEWIEREADGHAVFAESQRGIVPYVHSLTRGPGSRSRKTRLSLLAFHAEQDHPAIACIRGRWKLVCHLGRKADALYDVVDDPKEEVNRMSQETEVADALHEELRKRYLEPTAAREGVGIAPRRDALPMDGKVAVAQGVLRSALAPARETVLLWTGGKDSTLVLFLALDLARRERLRMPRTVVVDHGQHFPETWAFLREVAAKEGLVLDVARNESLFRAASGSADAIPFAGLEAADQEEALKAGFQGTRVPLSLDTQVGNHLMKTVALNRYLEAHGVDTVVTGIRWDENPARATEVFFSPRERPPHTRVHPILPWTERDVWTYTLSHRLPFHPLYRVGYRSLDGIFDSKPTDTRSAWAQDLDETPERAGRAQDKEHIMARLRTLGYF